MRNNEDEVQTTGHISSHVPASVSGRNDLPSNSVVCNNVPTTVSTFTSLLPATYPHPIPTQTPQSTPTPSRYVRCCRCTRVLPAPPRPSSASLSPRPLSSPPPPNSGAVGEVRERSLLIGRRLKRTPRVGLYFLKTARCWHAGADNWTARAAPCTAHR